MPPTRAQGEAALKYVVLTVMNQPEDGPIKKSLPEAMIENVEDLGSLIESDIENLTFIAADTNPTAIGPGHRGILRAFIAYIRHRATQPSPIGDDWNNVTREEFDAYHISPLFNGTIYGSTTVTNLGTPAAAPSSHARDPVTDFQRGIKRDDKQWDNWNRTHNAQARAQEGVRR
jgi:hypothetical protein